MDSSPSRDPRRVREMFGGIAPRYDFLNHLLSANLDRRWRKRAAREIPAGDDLLLLDLCGGTGDLSLELARRAGAGFVVCCDFSRPMLVRAARKFRRRDSRALCATLEGDALRLPFGNGTFDGVTVAFGVRNLADLDAGLREMLRVLRPGGRMIVLEFSRPSGPIVSRLYRLYLRWILPRVGDRISGRSGPYDYLADTISEFPDPPALAERIRGVGFSSCRFATLSGGIVALHTALKSD